MWNTVEIAKLLVSLATPLMVAAVGYMVSLRLKDYDRKQQRDEDDRKKVIERAQASERDEIERRHTPHIEVSIEVSFLGKRDGQHLTRIVVIAINRGQVLHKFGKITLRLRGIKDEPFNYIKNRAPHAAFPYKILDVNLVQESWNFIFVEPGVSQRISINTLVPVGFTYVLAHTMFEYKKYWPHTADTICAVPSSEA